MDAGETEELFKTQLRHCQDLLERHPQDEVIKMAHAEAVKATQQLNSVLSQSKDGATENQTNWFDQPGLTDALKNYTQSVLDSTYHKESQLVKEDFPIAMAPMNSMKEIIGCLSCAVRLCGASTKACSILGTEIVECLHWRIGALMYMYCHVLSDNDGGRRKGEEGCNFMECCVVGVAHLRLMMLARTPLGPEEDFVSRDPSIAELLQQGIFSDGHMLALAYSGDMCFWSWEVQTRQTPPTDQPRPRLQKATPTDKPHPHKPEEDTPTDKPRPHEPQEATPTDEPHSRKPAETTTTDKSHLHKPEATPTNTPCPHKPEGATPTFEPHPQKYVEATPTKQPRPQLSASDDSVAVTRLPSESSPSANGVGGQRSARDDGEGCGQVASPEGRGKLDSASTEQGKSEMSSSSAPIRDAESGPSPRSMCCDGETEHEEESDVGATDCRDSDLNPVPDTATHDRDPVSPHRYETEAEGTSLFSLLEALQGSDFVRQWRGEFEPSGLGQDVLTRYVRAARGPLREQHWRYDRPVELLVKLKKAALAAESLHPSSSSSSSSSLTVKT